MQYNITFISVLTVCAPRKANCIKLSIICIYTYIYIYIYI